MGSCVERPVIRGVHGFELVAGDKFRPRIEPFWRGRLHKCIGPTNVAQYRIAAKQKNARQGRLASKIESG